MMFAVIKTGGLQYRVAEDQVLKIGKVKGEKGEIIQLGNVVMLGGDKPQLGSPMISGASVAAEVIEQARGPKVIAFKKRRRKNSRRKRGFRASYTLIRVTEILTDGKAPSKAAKPRPQPKPKAEKPEGEARAKTAKAKTSAKKPKSAAKKPAPKAKGKK
jgi:large subunit ribosomal protein L21